MTKKLKRRDFIRTTAAAGLVLSAADAFKGAPVVIVQNVKPAVISSDNGNVQERRDETGVQRAFQLMTSGGDVLDAFIAGVNLVELDPQKTASATAAAQRRRRRAARLLLHARAGEARRRRGQLEGVRTPSLVAKAVMETDRPPPARRQGRAGVRARPRFKIEGDLNTENSRGFWLEWKRRADPEHYLDPRSAPSAAMAGR